MSYKDRILKVSELFLDESNCVESRCGAVTLGFGLSVTVPFV